MIILRHDDFEVDFDLLKIGNEGFLCLSFKFPYVIFDISL